MHPNHSRCRLFSLLLIGCSGGGEASGELEVKTATTRSAQSNQDEGTSEEATKEAEKKKLEEEQAAKEAEEKARAEAEAAAAAAAAATAAQEATEAPDEVTYVGNANTHKFHRPSCSSVDDMKESNKVFFYGDRQELIDNGYEPCKRCNP